LFIIIIVSENLINVLKSIRYSFGFVIFLIFFLVTNFKNSLYLKYFIRYLFLIIFLDAILLNLFVDTKNIYKMLSHAIFLDFYQRPVSFGESSAATATILISLFYYCEKIKKIKFNISDDIFFFISILLLFSTTGFILYLIYFFLKLINYKDKINIYFFFVFIIILSYLSINISQEYYDNFGKYINTQKISFSYLVNIISLKFNLVVNFFNDNLNFFNFFFGNQTLEDKFGTNSDFGMYVFFYQNGFLGFLFLFLFIFLFKKKKINFIAIIFLLLGSLHYSAINATMGQILFAFFLTQELGFVNEK
jgi:hypothetical protein